MAKTLFNTFLFLLTFTTMALASPKTKVNVLVIMVDDLRNSLGCYGDPIAHSPNIDKLAKDGVLFNKAYCQYSLCGPSRASIFTGLYPNNIGVHNNQTELRHKLPHVETLPGLFTQNSYLTRGFGKILHNKKYDHQSWSEPRYFLENYVYAPPNKVASADAHANNGKPMLFEGPDVPDDTYRDGKDTLEAIRTLQKAKDENKPFCLVLGYFKPHTPFNAPKKYWDLYDRSKFPIAEYQKFPKDTPEWVSYKGQYLRSFNGVPNTGPISPENQREIIHSYYACISYVDAQVGKVIAELKRLNLDQNTIIALVSDHGYQLGEHGVWCKHNNFELATRSPFMIYDPRIAKEHRGRVIEEKVELVDLVPTLWDLADLSEQTPVDGQSLKSLLRGEREEDSSSVAVSQYFIGKNHGYTIRTDHFRYTRWVDKNTNQTVLEELYDYERDPNETRNYTTDPEYAPILKKLRKRWDKIVPQVKKS